MGKISFYLLAFVFFTLVGCTSDTVSEPDNAEIPFESSFNLNVNEDSLYSGIDFVSKTEDIISINFFNGKLSFDKNGHFGYINIDLKTGTPTKTSKFYSYNNFSSHFFSFKLISIDEINKRIKGSFSGYIYANPLDLNSEKKFVSGDFDTYYENVVPAYIGLKNHAKINGNEWNRTNKYSTREAGMNNNNITQHDVSDGEYKIMVKYNLEKIELGTYNFSNSDVTNKIQLARFDTTTNTYINYDCTGILEITQKEGNIISGKYHFNAINPIDNSEKIQVTEGAFKLVYVYFP